jgi:hypothetical protein
VVNIACDTMDDKGLIEKGELPIKVSKEVVGHLSRGLYRNFARAIKELISNSYDGSATEAKIRLDLENAKVIIRDNGRGMEIDEIEKKFLNIGFPTALSEEIDELGRKRIGTFGIGFLSVFPYCRSLQIITKKRNIERIIEITIDTEQFFKEGTFLLERAGVPYKIFESDLPKEIGETMIILDDIKPHIIQDLRREPMGRSSLDKLGGYNKFKWTLCQYAPIQFPPNRKDLREFFEEPNRVPMRLWLDGTELFRNVPEGAIILEKEKERFDGIVMKYAIMTPKEPVEPEEARGLQIRLRDVAIGFPTDFDVVKLTGKVPGKLNYFCGEIHILEGFESALMIDRDSFSYTQEIADIYDFFGKKLIKWNNAYEDFAQEDKEIYKALQDIRDSDKVLDKLKNADIVHLSKERLRIPTKPRATRKKKKKVTSPAKKIKGILEKKEDYKVISKTEKVSQKEPPIRIIPEKKTIIINEEHPDFVERIAVGGEKFGVEYAEWNPKDTPYSICRVSKDESLVVFNSIHPLFNIDLDEDIVKKLSLGIVLISMNREDEKELVSRLNHLLQEVFLVG